MKACIYKSVDDRLLFCGLWKKKASDGADYCVVRRLKRITHMSSRKNLAGIEHAHVLGETGWTFASMADHELAWRIRVNRICGNLARAFL
jgi:hypothetical protein